MLSKEQHIQFWKESALEDWETAQVLFSGKRYSFCLFSLHLVVEKYLKAIWLKENDTNYPPYSHDLVRIAIDCNLDISPEQIDFLTVINSWNIRGRYPDYSRSLQNAATPVYVKNQIEKIEILKKWLDQKL